VGCERVTFERASGSAEKTDVEGGEVVFGLADEDVNACLAEFISLADMRPLITGECDTQSRPVHLINDADTFGVSVRDKNSNIRCTFRLGQPRAANHDARRTR